MRLRYFSAMLGVAFAAMSCAPQGDLKNAAPAGPVGADFFLAVANQYDKYPRYDNVARQAPMFCAAAVTPKIDNSQSQDSATHGQKLFYLYTWDRQGYMTATGKGLRYSMGTVGETMAPVPGGHAVKQILVKDALSQSSKQFAPAKFAPDMCIS